MAIRIPGSSGTDADTSLGAFEPSSSSPSVTPIIPASAAIDADESLGAFVPGMIISVSESLTGAATVGSAPVLYAQASAQMTGVAVVNALPTVVFTPISCNKTFYQRILDTVAGWCYYEDIVQNPAPLPANTSPNHTGALVAGSHQVISEIVL